MRFRVLDGETMVAGWEQLAGAAGVVPARGSDGLAQVALGSVSNGADCN
jgi:hypothetical protein